MRKKIGDILLSLLLFVIGICLLFWPGEIVRIISILLGCVFIVYGIIEIIKYLRYEPRSSLTFTIGVLSIIIGVILLLKQYIVFETISIIIGIFILISSIGSLTNAIENRNDNFKIAVGLSITGIVIGLICVLGKMIIPNIILEVLGVLLIVFCVTSIINTIVSPSRES